MNRLINFLKLKNIPIENNKLKLPEYAKNLV